MVVIHRPNRLVKLRALWLACPMIGTHRHNAPDTSGPKPAFATSGLCPRPKGRKAIVASCEPKERLMALTMIWSEPMLGLGPDKSCYQSPLRIADPGATSTKAAL